MKQAGRLAKLEADTLTAWRQAWQRIAVIFDKHTSEISLDATDLLQQLEVEHPDLSNDDVDRKGVAFLESLGVTQYRTFEAWFNSYELPEDNPPDLSSWPEMIPTPSDEPLGDWQRVAPYMASENVIERLAAQLYLSMLAAARAVREDHASTCSDS